MPRALVRSTAPERRAVGLGWLSLGLGLAELFAPRQVARLIGADEDDTTTRATLLAYGLREITCGVGLLSETRPEMWAWARVAGDALDLASVAYAWQRNPVESERMWSIGGSLLAIAALDVQTALAVSREQRATQHGGIAVRQGVTIHRPPEEVYAYFRNLENLPRFMSHVDEVVEANGRSRWRVTGPLGTHVQWEAEVTEDRPSEAIAWQSLPGADIPNRGRVIFRPAPGGFGTELIVELAYEAPLGALGATLAQLFGKEPSQQVSADLRRLKQVLETGEVLHSDASIHRGMHPAQPARVRARSAEQSAAQIPYLKERS